MIRDLMENVAALVSLALFGATLLVWCAILRDLLS